MTSFRLTFWGTRGSYPLSRKDTVQTGGNTSCVSIEMDGQPIILDAGTGLISLGESPVIQNYKSATVLLSHLHHDHILGIPFFKPIWDPAFTLAFYCSVSQPYEGVEKAFSTCFSPPFFPIPVVLSIQIVTTA